MCPDTEDNRGVAAEDQRGGLARSHTEGHFLGDGGNYAEEKELVRTEDGNPACGSGRPWGKPHDENKAR